MPEIPASDAMQVWQQTSEAFLRQYEPILGVRGTTVCQYGCDVFGQVINIHGIREQLDRLWTHVLTVRYLRSPSASFSEWHFTIAPCSYVGRTEYVSQHGDGDEAISVAHFNAQGTKEREYLVSDMESGTLFSWMTILLNHPINKPRYDVLLGSQLSARQEVHQLEVDSRQLLNDDHAQRQLQKQIQEAKKQLTLYKLK